MIEKSANPNLMNSMTIPLNGNPFEKVLQKFEEQLSVKQIEEYLVEGENAVRAAISKDICILIGTTGAGKTTTLLYLIGEDMKEKEISVENRNEDGSIQ